MFEVENEIPGMLTWGKKTYFLNACNIYEVIFINVL